MTHLKLHTLIAALSWCILVAKCLPTSLVEEVKDNEVRNFKVKRAHDSADRLEKSANIPPFYNKPTAIKRDTSRNEQYQGWTNEGMFSNVGGSHFPYAGSGDVADDKALGDYEKAYKHAENQAKLDEALRNAILKSEIYGDSSSMNQYKYYLDDQRRRRRRNTQKFKYARMKREVDLSPEEILTILNLLEKERQGGQSQSGNFETLDFSQSYPSNYPENDDETWLNGPVYPHVSTHKTLKEQYYEKPQVYGKFSQYNDGYNKDTFDLKPKRFKVAKRRSDPTKELRYLNGPSVNDYYTLAQLLSNQREPNVPVYHRAVL